MLSLSLFLFHCPRPMSTGFDYNGWPFDLKGVRDLDGVSNVIHSILWCPPHSLDVCSWSSGCLSGTREFCRLAASPRGIQMTLWRVDCSYRRVSCAPLNHRSPCETRVFSPHPPPALECWIISLAGRSIWFIDYSTCYYNLQVRNYLMHCVVLVVQRLLFRESIWISIEWSVGRLDQSRADNELCKGEVDEAWTAGRIPRQQPPFESDSFCCRPGAAANALRVQQCGHLAEALSDGGGSGSGN